MKKRVLSLVLAVMMCLALLPVTAFAAEEGESTYAHSINGGLDLTAGDTPSSGDGYTWTGDETNGYTLTLSGVEIQGDLTLPTNCTVTVITNKDSSITGDITFKSKDQYNYSNKLIFDGDNTLTVGGYVCASGDNDDNITVQNGASVEVKGTVQTGGSGGVGGTITVTGAGSSLTVLGTMKKGSESSMTISNLRMKEGGKLTANCEISVSSVEVDDKDSSIVIDAGTDPAIKLLTTVGWDDVREETKEGFKNMILPLLPDGYIVGEKSNSYTVLDSEGNIATSLTLQTEHPHTHDISAECGSSDASTKFTPWDGTAEITYVDHTASVYLTANVTRTQMLDVPEGNTLNLCFNGHTITHNGSADSNAIRLYNGNGTLRLCDCGSTPGGITMQQGYYAIYLPNNGCTVEMYGGKLTGGTSGCIGEAPENKITINGGELSGNDSYCIHSGDITINGGTFSGKHKTVIYSGGAKGAVTINGGTFSGSGDTIFAVGGNDSGGYAKINLNKVPTITGTYTTVFRLSLENVKIGVASNLTKPNKPLLVSFFESGYGVYSKAPISITTGWKDNMNTANPADYFASNDPTDSRNSDTLQAKIGADGEVVLAIPTYTITKAPCESGGSFTISRDDLTESKAGKIWAVYVTPPEGKLPDTVTVTNTKTNEEVSVTYRWPDEPYFTMPAAPVKVSVTFKNQDLSLSSITIKKNKTDSDNITLSPTFTSDTTEYAATVPYEINSVVINATAKESSVLALYITSEGYATYANNATVNLAVGENIITFLGYKDSTTYSQYKVTITRQAPPLTGITLTPATLNLTEGKQATLTVGAQPTDAVTGTISWTSSDETIATVDESGVVTAIKAGAATITATAGGQTATCAVTVTKPAASGGGSSSTYPITTDDTPHGTVKADPANAGKGTTVTLTVTPEEGYVIDDVTVTDQDGKEIPVTDQGDGKYTFPMPAGKVTVSASFTKGDAGYAHCPKDETCPIWPFTDASPTAWYHDGVHYCLDNGLMGGYPGSLFGPDDATTRGMIVTILYRLEGEPAASGSDFTDVPAGQYYTDAVAWAAANGIVNGYGDGAFGPEDPITREQMAAILYRYAAYKEYDVTARADLSGYTDADQISPYAAHAMAWVNGEGILAGTSATTLDPAGSATRAQAATILMRFCEDIAK